MNRLRRHNVRSKIIDIIICGYELEDIESLLPEELYNNDFSFITLVAIMGATLKLDLCVGRNLSNKKRKYF